MKIDKDTNVLIVGLGMIGGSYAKGLAKKGILANAIDIDEDTIRYAKEHHIINKGSTSADPKMIGAADVIIPVFIRTPSKNGCVRNNGSLRAAPSSPM